MMKILKKVTCLNHSIDKFLAFVKVLGDVSDPKSGHQVGSNKALVVEGPA